MCCFWPGLLVWRPYGRYFSFLLWSSLFKIVFRLLFHFSVPPFLSLMDLLLLLLDIPQLCYGILGFNVFSLFRSVWGSFSTLVLLGLYQILGLVSFIPRDFLGITVHISAVYLSGIEGHPLWFWALSENILELRISSLVHFLA